MQHDVFFDLIIFSRNICEVFLMRVVMSCITCGVAQEELQERAELNESNGRDKAAEGSQMTTETAGFVNCCTEAGFTEVMCSGITVKVRGCAVVSRFVVPAFQDESLKSRFLISIHCGPFPQVFKDISLPCITISSLVVAI
jgi:hypothetical protein